MGFLERLEEIENTYNDLERQLSQPGVYDDRQRYTELARAHADLADVVSSLREYREAVREAQDARDMLEEEQDEEMLDFLRDSLQAAENRSQELERKIKLMLVPADPRDAKDVIVEIRAGAGGEEASLFAGDLYRMYTRYADRRGWKNETLSSSPSERGGLKEIIFSHVSSGKSSMGSMCWKPALLTRMCTVSNASRARSMSFLQSSRRLRSASTNSPFRRAADSLPALELTSPMTTRAPSAAKRSATARPMPLAPPVTTAVLPWRGPSHMLMPPLSVSALAPCGAAYP